MTDLIPITDEQAKLGQEALKTLRGLGAFLRQALGSTPEDLIGYLGGDWLRLRRAENMARMFADAKARLIERGVEEPQPASLSIAIPMLHGAADEDREELVNLWSRLLANAMDPKLNNIRYEFIEIVRQLNPIDAVVLRALYEKDYTLIRRAPLQANEPGAVSIPDLAAKAGSGRDDVEVAIDRLNALGLLRAHSQESWVIAVTLRVFMRACYP